MNDEALDKLIKTLETLWGSHRNDLIVEQAKKILALQPNNQFANIALIDAYYGMSQYENMYAAVKSALTIWPGNPWFYQRLFFYYLAKGGKDYLYAKEAIEKSILLDPTCSNFYRNLGEIYLINREPQKAARYLEKATELDPDNPEYRSRLALALLRCKQRGKSIAMAKEALKDDPDNHKVLDNVGMVLVLSGELEKAEELFRSALQRFPTYDYYQKHLDWVLREKKDRETRNLQNKEYTPLYLRHTGTKKYFDEDVADSNIS